MPNMIKLHFVLRRSYEHGTRKLSAKTFFRKSCIRYMQNIDQEMNF